MTPTERAELFELTSLLCENALDDAAAQRLNALLRDDVEARRLYLQYVDLHARLLMQPPALDAVAAPLGAVPTVRPTVAPAPVIDRPPATSARGARRFAWCACVVTAGVTLALSWLVQSSWRSATVDAAAAPPPPPVPLRVTPYVATLIRGVDCVWSDGRERLVGTRVTLGKLTLLRGTAALHFDADSEVWLQGLAELTVDRPTGATLHRGTALVRGGHATFRLTTPRAHFVDVGTRYVLTVDEQGEEVHVFDGEVVRTTKSAPPAAARVVAGRALRFSSAAGLEGQAVSLDAARLEAFAESDDPAPGAAARRLIAAEAFENFAPKADAVVPPGAGWSGPWQAAHESPAGGFRKTFALCRNVHQRDPESNAVLATGNCSISRRLQKPLTTAADGVLYFSLLTRAEGVAPGETCDLRLLLTGPDETPPARRLSLKLSWRDGTVGMKWEGSVTSASLPIELQRTYLVAGKIVTSAQQSDQAFVRVYCPQRRLSLDEPTDWSLASRPVGAAATWDTVRIETRTTTPVIVDELRIGDSWAAVIEPYCRPAPADKQAAQAPSADKPSAAAAARSATMR